MGTTKEERLAAVLAAVQAQWGAQAIISASQLELNKRERLPTRISSVDELLDGGVATGELTLLVGRQTAGGATLIFRTIASVQHNGGYAAYIDLEHVFDAEYASQCGVVLETLLVVRPRTLVDGLENLCELFRHSAITLAAVDLVLARTHTGNARTVSASALRTFSLALRSSGAAVIVLENQPSSLFQSIASVTAELTHRQWLYSSGIISGYEGEIRIVKGRLPLLGRVGSLAICFDQSAGVVKGDLA